MYGNTTASASLAGFGTVAAVSGWTVTGWCILAVAVLTAVILTLKRLARKPR